MASGDTLAVFTTLSAIPPSSNFATHDTRGTHPVLDFDATTNESTIFAGVMPQHYDGGGVTVYITFGMSSATSGDVDWDVAFEDATTEDMDADSFAAVNSVDNTTVPATSGQKTTASVAFTDGADMDSVGAGDKFRIQITRDATNDTASGDAELWSVEIRET